METTNEAVQEETSPAVSQEEQPSKATQNGAPQSPAQRKANAFELTYAVSNLVCQFTALLAMLFGVVTLFSQTVNPISAINNIIALFSIRRGTIYKTLASVAASVVYVVMLILMAKTAIHAVRMFLKIVKKSDVPSKWNNLLYSFYDAKDGAYKAVFFTALCKMLSGGSATVGFYFVVIIFLIDYALTATLLFLQRNKANFLQKETITELLFSVLRTVVVIVCACLAAHYLILPSGLDLAFGIRSLFSSVGWSARIIYALYDLVVKHVLDIVLAFLYLKIIGELFSDAGYSPVYRCSTDEHVKSLSRKLMIVAGVSAAISCILLAASGFTVQFEPSLFSGWFFLLKAQYLPAVLLTATFYVLAAMPFDKKTEKPSARKATA